MKINVTKTLGIFSTIFGLYAVITTLVIVFALGSTPQQIFKSTEVGIIIKDLNSETIRKDFLKPENLNKLKHILAIPKSGEPALYVYDSKSFNPEPKQYSGLKDILLQYASGSNNAYAGNCPSQRYIHGTNCTGPHYIGDTLVIPRTCDCVRI